MLCGSESARFHWNTKDEVLKTAFSMARPSGLSSSCPTSTKASSSMLCTLWLRNALIQSSGSCTGRPRSSTSLRPYCLMTVAFGISYTPVAGV
jgi:hypothetical protein